MWSLPESGEIVLQHQLSLDNDCNMSQHRPGGARKTYRTPGTWSSTHRSKRNKAQKRRKYFSWAPTRPRQGFVRFILDTRCSILEKCYTKYTHSIFSRLLKKGLRWWQDDMVIVRPNHAPTPLQRFSIVTREGILNPSNFKFSLLRGQGVGAFPQSWFRAVTSVAAAVTMSLLDVTIDFGIPGTHLGCMWYIQYL